MKIYRCVKTDGNQAEMMLFDKVMGKNLEVIFVQEREFWNQYYIIEEKNIIENYEERYIAFAKEQSD